MLVVFFLIRFSQFFVSPLVKMEAMEREVLAVDSGMCYSYLILLVLFSIKTTLITMANYINLIA